MNSLGFVGYSGEFTGVCGFTCATAPTPFNIIPAPHPTPPPRVEAFKTVCASVRHSLCSPHMFFFWKGPLAFPLLSENSFFSAPLTVVVFQLSNMSTSFKRKRGSSAGYPIVLSGGPPRVTYKKRKRTFVPGRDRVGGFYGRYAGSRLGRAGELKFFDVNLDDAIIASGFNMTPSINLIPQGITESTRIGRKCTITNINWRYRLQLPDEEDQANVQSGDIVRVVVYIDKQCNGAAAADTDVFEADSIQSFRNLSNSGRFTILMDRLHSMNRNSLAADMAGLFSSTKVLREFTWFKKCNIPIEFNSTTGVLTEIRSNNIGIAIGSSQGLAKFDSRIRLRFSDN